ncbi:hypothetical protein [Paucibacter soli]|uniref:hypothetical protein n=1 Tax=Paucibacter soli TaxID=3133433 RepID=UPI00309656BE
MKSLLAIACLAALGLVGCSGTANKEPKAEDIKAAIEANKGFKIEFQMDSKCRAIRDTMWNCSYKRMFPGYDWKDDEANFRWNGDKLIIL